jgi:hypothetical protein
MSAFGTKVFRTALSDRTGAFLRLRQRSIRNSSASNGFPVRGITIEQLPNSFFSD